MLPLRQNMVTYVNTLILYSVPKVCLMQGLSILRFFQNCTLNTFIVDEDIALRWDKVKVALMEQLLVKEQYTIFLG